MHDDLAQALREAGLEPEAQAAERGDLDPAITAMRIAIAIVGSCPGGNWAAINKASNELARAASKAARRRHDD